MIYELVTRKEAIAVGMTKYFTGKPCSRGHIKHRYTLTAACVDCIRGYKRVSKNQLNANKMRESQGFIEFVVQSHPLDAPAIREFTEMVNEWRNNPNDNEKLRMLGAYMEALKFG